MKDKVLQILVEDCITHRLTEIESLQYINERHKNISDRTLRRYKKKIESDDTLNIYFNEHARIGFVRDQKKRKDEMDAVLTKLMNKWHSVKDDDDIHRTVRLAEAIIGANKRLEEISLSNPVISQIKNKLDNYESNQASRETITQ